MAENSIIFLLDANLPYVRHPCAPGCVEEARLFNALSGTYLPLLRVCTALETEAIPFKIAIAFSPTLCEMFADPLLQDRYAAYLDRTLSLGLDELERTADDPSKRSLLTAQLDQVRLNRRDFVEIYEKNILRKFDYFAGRGFIELLATAATNCALPLFIDIPETINAQIETGLVLYRRFFTTVPSGFWLPAMAWTPALGAIVKSYGFSYTVLESHALLFSDPPPAAGVFAPTQCDSGLVVFARDSRACQEILDEKSGFASRAEYLDVNRDIGFEFGEEELSSVFDTKLGRRATGYRYWARGSSSSVESQYDVDAARGRVRADAQAFLKSRSDTLRRASEMLEGAPVSSVCAFPASVFGEIWAEGVDWLDSVFRQNAESSDLSGSVNFALPAAKIGQGSVDRRVSPHYSSWFPSGYFEEVLNGSNDWMYSYVRKATARMIDLAERFPDDTGLKERSLNMAARELLLSQTMDWFLMMNEGDSAEYAKKRFEDSVRAFTIVYESLGSNFISTEWLTTTEKEHNLFTDINYRVFSKKK